MADELNRTDAATIKPRPRRRPTILLLMVVVACAALALGGLRAKREAERRVRVERLRAALVQAEARLAWAEQMQGNQYVSAPVLKAVRLKRDKILSEMEVEGIR